MTRKIRSLVISFIVFLSFSGVVAFSLPRTMWIYNSTDSAITVYPTVGGGSVSIGSGDTKGVAISQAESYRLVINSQHIGQLQAISNSANSSSDAPHNAQAGSLPLKYKLDVEGKPGTPVALETSGSSTWNNVPFLLTADTANLEQYADHSGSFPESDNLYVIYDNSGGYFVPENGKIYNDYNSLDVDFHNEYYKGVIGIGSYHHYYEAKNFLDRSSSNPDLQGTKVLYPYKVKWALINAGEDSDTDLFGPSISYLKSNNAVSAAVGDYYVTISALPSNKTKFDIAYVFGDSLSDNRNYFDITHGIIPRGGYYDGRFSNGPNWQDDITSILGLRTVDFAVGAAQIIKETPGPNKIGTTATGKMKDNIYYPGNSSYAGQGTAPSLPHEIIIWQNYIRAYPSTAKVKSIYFFLAGGNDFGGWSRGSSFAGMVTDFSQNSGSTIPGYNKNDSISYNEDNAYQLGKAMARQVFYEATYGIRRTISDVSGVQPTIVFMQMPSLNLGPAYSPIESGNRYSSINASAQQFAEGYNVELNTILGSYRSSDPSDGADTLIFPLQGDINTLVSNYSTLGLSADVVPVSQVFTSSTNASATIHITGESENNSGDGTFYNDYNFMGYSQQETTRVGDQVGVKYKLLNYAPVAVNTTLIYDMIHPAANMGFYIAADATYWFYENDFITQVPSSGELHDIITNHGFSDGSTSFNTASAAFQSLLKDSDSYAQARPDFSSEEVNSLPD